MRLLVTGCSGHLGRILVPRLLAASGVRTVVGLDRVKPTFAHPRFAFVRADVRDTDLAQHFAGIDAVIHLAFVVMQGDLGAQRFDRALMRAINVEGSMNIFNLAAAAGTKTVVHLSSAAVYALPSAQARIDEQQPRRALPGFAYAEDKIAVEDWLDEYEQLHRDVRLVRLRPHIILGPNAHRFFKTLLRLPFYPTTTAQWQCVHEDDVVHAVRLALFNSARGAFNLATDDAHSYRTLQRHLRRWALPLPTSWVRAGLGTAWRRFGWGTDPGWSAALEYSLVLDIGAARQRLGWAPRFDFLRTCSAALNK